MDLGQGLNQSALRVVEDCVARAESLGIQVSQSANGARILDFGVEARGGLEAGVQMAAICMSGKSQVSISSGNRGIWAGPWVQVTTDHPIQACMLSQYAGWPVKSDDFFAMGSGAMRVRRGKEDVLKSLDAHDGEALAVGTLECDCLPNNQVIEMIAQECSVPVSALNLAVAPTRSIAGCVQVVARSIETSLHKLFELGFPLEQVRSAYGVAPLPPPTPDFATGIGRTNDAILYGGHVSLWVEGEDSYIKELCRGLPSAASRDFGAPFAEIFKRYKYDFYQVDPGLFSPAEVMVFNLSSGNSWHFGELREDLVAKSFATELA